MSTIIKLDNSKIQQQIKKGFQLPFDKFLADGDDNNGIQLTSYMNINDFFLETGKFTLVLSL